MSYAVYPVSKHSGVEWLGEVPEHWDVKALRYLAVIKNGSDYKHVEIETGGYAVIGSGGEFARASNFLYDKPSVLLGRKGTIDKPLYTEAPFWTVDTMYYTQIHAFCHPRFLYYFSTTIPFSYFEYGSALPSMTQRDLYSLAVPQPPLAEQQAIASFLDAECARIDQLIERQNRLIQLLQEKRQAVITHAVTRGLNADAPLKHSGVEWLGEVPEHWEVRSSRRLFAHRNERARADDVQLTASQKHGIISKSDFMQIENQRVMEVITGADILKHVEPNDFVISMRSFEGGLEWSRQRGCISSAYVMLTAASRIVGEYFAYLFKSRPYIQALQATSNLVRDGQALRYSNFTQVALPLPPLAQQQAIVEHLDAETKRIDNTIAKAQRSIELMQERRSALISAAVTGKIDVRNHSEQRTH